MSNQPYASPHHLNQPKNATTNSLAVASLVLGLASLLLSCVTGLIGLILGIVALNQISSSGGTQKGSGMALAGIIISIVFSIISGLVLPLLMLVPAYNQVQVAAQTSITMNNFKQVMLAEHNHEFEHGFFPVDKNGLSWRVHLLPYLGEQSLYDQFNLDEPWDSPTNKKLLPLMPLFYESPGVEGVESGKTLFLRPVGNGAFPKDNPIKFSNIIDGSSNTIMLIEVDPSASVNWTEPGDYEFDPANPKRDLGQARIDMILIGTVDGAVHRLEASISPDSLRGGFTHNGGELTSF